MAKNRDYSTASETIAEPVNLALEPCPICTRTFVPVTLAKHVKICEKMAIKKRKVFDSSRQRREGTDLACFLPKNYGLPANKQEPKTSPKVVQNTTTLSPKRQEEVTKQAPISHKKLINPVTSPTSSQPPHLTQPAPSKEREKSKITSKRNVGPSSEQCPHCERCFGIKAYDRHVEWCKEKSRIANIQNNTTLTAAKERLQARTKYRAPCLKTKRQVNREKYSGFTSEDLANSLFDAGDVSGTKADGQKKSMSTSLNSSIMSEGLDPSSILQKILKNKSDVASASPRLKNNTRKSIGSLKKLNLSKSTQEDSPPGKSIKAKAVKLPKSRKLFDDYIPVLEDLSKNILEDDPKTLVHTEQLLKSLSVNQAKLEADESCILIEDEEDIFFDATENQISNRTRRLYLSDSETENPEKNLFATDELMSSNCNTRRVLVDEATPSPSYIDYDEVPVGGLKVLQDFLNQKTDPIPTFQNTLNNSENSQRMQSSYEREEDEISEFLSKDTMELSSHQDNITQKCEKTQSLPTENLNSNITELYNNSHFSKKNIKRTEIERVRSAISKLSRGKTEFSNSSANDSAASWDFPEEDEDVTKKKEIKSPSSLAKSVTKKLNRSPIGLNLDGFENEEQKREIFISIETSQNDNSPSPTSPRPILPDSEEVDKNANMLQKPDSARNSAHDEKQDVFQDIPDVNRNNARNIMKKLEHDFNQNEATVPHGCDPVNSLYPADSDEISSVEYFVVPRNTMSKQSADSAYGSLSRHSPTDQRSQHRNSSRTRQQSASSIPEQQPSKPKYLQKTDIKQQRSRNLSSASSSGSDTSLPPIRPQMMDFLGKDMSHQRPAEPRMSKFCHECGNKFLITHAKFCMECGVRRVVLE